jgi:sugar lactone lactonase YvrE
MTASMGTGRPGLWLTFWPVILNNYFGRQFNSLNDVGVNPRNLNIYFTDPRYAYIQSFRPLNGLPTQVYRFSDVTGAVSVVADDLNEPNGRVQVTEKGMVQRR